MTNCCRDLAAQRRHFFAREATIRWAAGGASLSFRPRHRRSCSVSVRSAASRFCAAASASPFVRRPPLPVPVIFAGSSFSSSTMRRTAGESAISVGRIRRLRRPRSATAATGFALARPSPCSWVPPRLRLIHQSLLRLRRFSPPDLRQPWSLRTPSVSATISVETLSVSRVKSGSPAFTYSPDFLCQTETMPLEIDSPTAGIFTSTLIARLHKRKPPCESNAKSFHRTIQAPVVAGCRQRNTARSCSGCSRHGCRYGIQMRARSSFSAVEPSFVAPSRLKSNQQTRTRALHQGA